MRPYVCPSKWRFVFSWSAEFTDKLQRPSQPDSLGGSSFCHQTLRLGSLKWAQTFLLWENFYVIIIFQFVGCSPGRYGFIMIVPFLSIVASSLPLDVQDLLVVSSVYCWWISAVSYDLGTFLRRGDAHPSTLPSCLPVGCHTISMK